MKEFKSSPLLEANQVRQNVLLFRLEHQTYAVQIEWVRQIIEMVTISPIPQVTHSVAGMINFHGATVPVINLRHHLGLPELPLQLHTPIILVTIENRLMGLLVDEVLDVQGLLPDHMIQPDQVLPEEFGGVVMISGLAQTPQGLVIVLDLEHLFRAQHAHSLAEVAQAMRRIEPPSLLRETPALTEDTALEEAPAKLPKRSKKAQKAQAEDMAGIA